MYLTLKEKENPPHRRKPQKEKDDDREKRGKSDEKNKIGVKKREKKDKSGEQKMPHITNLDEGQETSRSVCIYIYQHYMQTSFPIEECQIDKSKHS